MSIALESGVGDIFFPHLSVRRKEIYRRFSSRSIYPITPHPPVSRKF